MNLTASFQKVFATKDMNIKDTPIIIADDHPIMLKGLYRELISNEYKVVGQANDGMKALELILTLKPALALLDIDMPILTGLDIIKMAKGKMSKTKFILLSYHKESAYVEIAKSLNVCGYMLKEDPFMELEKCMEMVISDKEYYSSSLDARQILLADNVLRSLHNLTPSERIIIKLIAEENSTQQIAESLNVSTRTIEKHRSNIISKLNLDKGTNALTNWSLTHKKTIVEL